MPPVIDERDEAGSPEEGTPSGSVPPPSAYPPPGPSAHPAAPPGPNPPPAPFGSASGSYAPPPASSPPPPYEAPERRGLFERAVPELVKRVIERAVESGVEKLTELSEKPETLRNFVSELRLPKEVLADVYAQIDDTKNGLYRVVAKEIRDVLEQTQIAEELAKVLTKLSFEIKTEIRFVPNDRSADSAAGGASGEDDKGKPESGGGLRPKVTSEVTVKDRAVPERRDRR